MKTKLLLLLLGITTLSSAQFEDIFASGQDANKFVSQYTTPAVKGLMYASNAAWITSAKPIKPFHFELNIGASGAFIPAESESFKFNSSDYQYLQVESGPDVMPTVMGNVSQTVLKIEIPDPNGNEVRVLEFNSPDGIKDNLPMNIVPTPSIQASMGLPLGSEVNIRYAPEIKSDNGGFIQILGLGFKHSLTQYFPKSKDANGKTNKRHFNLAAHISYQNIRAGYDDPNSNKAAHLNISTVSLQGIASLDYKLLSLYSAIGYTKGFSNISILGTYGFTYDVQDNNGNHIRTENVSVNDPLKLDYNLNGMKAKAGVKIKLAFFQIYADYTLQEFPVATAGIGFRF